MICTVLVLMISCDLMRWYQARSKGTMGRPAVAVPNDPGQRGGNKRLDTWTLPGDFWVLGCATVGGLHALGGQLEGPI